MRGGVEAGGTKFVCLIGTDPDHVPAMTRIEVTDPQPTLAAAVRFFQDAVDDGIALEALGVGSFGPVELRRGDPAYGHITQTPKPGWSNVDMITPFANALGVPVAFDTDVNAAALAEGRWGAGMGLHSFVYLTVGTGIGGGAVIDGRVLHGLGHPEMGHVAVPRRPEDRFPGVCPFHGDCLEGLASGPAIAARFGRRAEELDARERSAAVTIAAWYLAAGVSTLVYSLAPQRVVIGGGFGSMSGLVQAIRTELLSRLGGYPGLTEHDDRAFIVSARLGDRAGPLGTLILAEQPASPATEGA